MKWMPAEPQFLHDDEMFQTEQNLLNHQLN